MRLTAVILLYICVHCSVMNGQSIRLVRSDVDTTRAHFITATYRFGIDVKIEDAGRCSAAAFELRYTNAQYVQYSGYSAAELGGHGVAVFADPMAMITGAGKLNIGVVSGNDVAVSPRNPVVIHLDFVTTSDAPHNALSTFSFSVAQAVTDSGTVTLQSNIFPYTIRSFVTVFPGDANNDGIVDTRDWTAVGEFTGGTRFRGYMRNPASVYWQPQKALAWDSAEATYADCDGSGDVTVKDILVIGYNFGKRKFSVKPGEEVQNADAPKSAQNEYPHNAVKVPIILTSDKEYIGFTTRINWHNNSGNYRVLGIEPGEMFPENNQLRYIRIDTVSSSAEIAFAMPGNEIPASNTSPVAYLIIEQYGPDVFPLPMLQNPYGITASGLIFSMNNISTGLENNELPTSLFSVKTEQNSLLIQNPDILDYSLCISDVLGKVIMCEDNIKNTETKLLDISFAPNGYYIVTMQSGGKIYSHPLIITH